MTKDQFNKFVIKKTHEERCKEIIPVVKEFLGQVTIEKTKQQGYNFSAEALEVLEDVFSTTPEPNDHIIDGLVKQLHAPPLNIKAWFSDR